MKRELKKLPKLQEILNKAQQKKIKRITKMQAKVSYRIRQTVVIPINITGDKL